jgi:sugar-specific transcriptional regulator TrmB
MDTNLLITIQNYGFSDKEAKIYLTTLELGSAIASTIARRAELKRVTVYALLNDMKRK